MTEAEKPLDHNDIAKTLGLAEEAQVDALQKRLRAMERDERIVALARPTFGLPSVM